MGKRLVRNMFLGPAPEKLAAKYPKCANNATMYDGLGDDVTIVVTVKDSCSQAPGFIDGLTKIAPRDVRVIYTYPDFTSCRTINLDAQKQNWDNFTLIPLDPHVSPMQGWVDGGKLVTTPYTYLVHNDGYALDEYFLCEMVEALKQRKQNRTADSQFVIAAPALYESKHDGSYAAHATQSNLRLVQEGNIDIVRHDHSLEMALRRQGEDLIEGEQTDFLEDHGFLIETDKIGDVIDPDASFTMEYLDMIMTIMANNWKVLLVPTSRLEFRITEFSWRDIPYFMYKRSEITAHGTRDYLKAKWKVDFPNTGFWTFIKYTIVERHSYELKCPKGVDPRECEELPRDMAWTQQALLAVGFFQMVGWNRYQLSANSEKVGFLGVMDEIEKNGWKPSGQGIISASREKVRPSWPDEKVRPIPNGLSVKEILGGYGTNPPLKIEADLKDEYFPFSAAELKVKSCTEDLKESLPVCGLVVDHGDSCSCWINLQTFKNGGIIPSLIDWFAALIKIPSRISTYYEMTTMNDDVEGHTARLERFVTDNDENGKGTFRMVKCFKDDTECNANFTFTEKSKVVQFLGRPFNPIEVARALDNHFK